MLKMNNIIKQINDSIRNNLYPLNDYYIKEYRRNQIDNILEFISSVYEEACKMFDGNVEYLGYYILTPEERVEYELTSKYNKVNIDISEWNLVRFNFRFNYQDSNDYKEFYSYLYIPYQVNDFIILDNINYGIQFFLTDQVFTKDKYVVVKLLRSPIKFSTRLCTLIPLNEQYKNIIYVDVPTTKIHHKTSNRNLIPILLYFICKFGLQQTLELFKVENILKIVNNQDIDILDLDNYYFKLSKRKKDYLGLKVNKESFDNSKYVRNIVASIIYILSKFMLTDILAEELYEYPEHWYIFLGKIIYGRNSLNKAKLYNNIEKHIQSLDLYLDPITKRKFKSFGFEVNNIYDILYYMFINVSDIKMKYFQNDMRLKRSDVLEQTLISYVVSKILRKIYNYKNRNTKYKENIIIKLFNLKFNIIQSIKESDNVTLSLHMYNDCKLFNYMSKIIKPSKKDSKNDDNLIDLLSYNPTYLLVYSSLGFSTSKPDVSGTINPFIQINEYGGYIINDEINELLSNEVFKYFK